MKTEFEISFLNIDREEVIQKIQKIGGKCIQENTLMKRHMFLHSEKENAYFRVRDEGNNITCTYKEVATGKLDIHAMKELEIEVSNYDDTVAIFVALGHKIHAYQESYRETWKIGENVYIMIDLWPGLQPYIEIEAETEELVREYTKSLGFDYNTGYFGTVKEIYEAELGISNKQFMSLREVTFDNIPKK